MIAVIMAAGMGTRFGAYTELQPKGFVEVLGKPMIIHSIEALISQGIERIIIGTGYKHEMYDALKEVYPQIQTCYSPRYAETNSMYTLYNTRETIGDEDFLLLESDLVYEPRAIKELLDCTKPDVMLVSSLLKFQDQYYVEFDNHQNLVNCSTDKDALTPMSELVGIHKLSNRFYTAMYNDYGNKLVDFPKLGYEYEILHIAQTALPVYVLKPDELKWYEIDDEDDLKYAETNIAPFLVES